MPIPAAAAGGDMASAVLALFEQLHDRLRNEVKGLSAEALNWVPTERANSAATIVVHVVGSEAETLRTVAGLPSERNREAEFAGATLGVSEVLGLIEEADELIDTVRVHIDSERLERTYALPTLPATETRTGFTWLIGNYGHACEHLGHIQLTMQLYPGAPASDS